MTNPTTLERRIVLLKRLIRRLFGLKNPEQCSIDQFQKVNGLVERIMREI